MKGRNLCSLAGVKESSWTEVFGPEFTLKGSWWSLYKPPIKEQAADLQWRMVHGAIAINRHMRKLFFTSSLTVTGHLIYLHCCEDCLRVWFSFELFVAGPKCSVRRRKTHILVNVISSMAKLAFWISRGNRMRGVGCTEPAQVFKGLLAARLWVSFSLIWAVRGVLCTVDDEGGLVMTLW